jgi:gliding motility-associated-like protein
MRLKDLLLYPILLLALASPALAQDQPPGPCTALGQNPSTAFPVCGTKVFNQETVPICGVHGIPNSCAQNGIEYQDKNPYWYTFTCFKSGTLGFIITPKDILDDYDWQLFDVTNHQPDEVYTNKQLYVAMGWSGETGITGTNASGTVLGACGGTGQPLFTKMPDIIKGHKYLLLISHFSNSQSGYSLEFTGGTGVITDSVTPALDTANYNCGPYTIGVRLNKIVYCSSLASNGSDFKFVTPGYTITSATGTDCSSSGFSFDSLVLTVNTPLAPGDYTIASQTGTDGNTLLDVCGNALPVGQTLSFHVDPPPPVFLQQQVVPGCAPDVIKVSFSTPIRCSSLKTSGAEFSITGPQPVTITGVSGDCSEDASDTVYIQLSRPILTSGDYTIQILSNNMQGVCHQSVQAGQSVNFHTADTVNASITYGENRNCALAMFTFSNDGNNGINSWLWSFNDTTSYNTQTVTKAYKSNYGDKTVKLLVSNGVCTDSSTLTLPFPQTLGAAFDVDPGPYCPLDVTTFKNESIGGIVSYMWDYGNGNSSTGPEALPQQYTPSAKTQNFFITLTVVDTAGCQDMAVRAIEAVASCYIDVPTAFSPNGDGENDYLYPLNAYKAVELSFVVYNRVGQKVFETQDWTKKWDGTVNGNPADIGTYVWMLRYTMKDTGKKVFRKGTTTLIR